jgi:N-acetyl-beta-hexosaminidase
MLNLIPGVQEYIARPDSIPVSDLMRLVTHPKDESSLIETLHTMQAEFLIRGIQLEIAVLENIQSGDIFCTLNQQVVNHPQGYSLEIDQHITVVAATPTGIFYGLQTLRQLAAHSSLPKGTIRDWPRYAFRSLMLDIGRKYWEMDYLRSLMGVMGGLKLNELHLHFSDATAFRLQSDRHPELSAEKSYSKVEIAQLQAWADQYHITLTPEIDLPAHSVVFNSYNSRLAFKCRSMAYGRWPEAKNGNWTINYADPYARQWVEELLSEYIPLFSGPYFHLGTDEVPDGDAPSQCPELAAYARSRGYPSAGDVLVEWINSMNNFIRSFGKRMQIWSWWERAPHSILPDKDIVVNAWVAEGDSQIFLDSGYSVVHTAEDSLYLTPGLELFPKEEYLYHEWVLSTHPNSLGYKLCVWTDHAANQSDDFFEQLMYRARTVFAERTRNGAPPTQTLSELITFAEKAVVS